MALHLVTGYSGKAHITSADQGAFHVAMLLGGNYVLNRGNKFAANIVSNNLIEVLDGELIMQGRYARVNSGATMEAVIENGTQDYKRNDLIVARYTKDAVAEVESVDLVVIKGTPSETEAVDPEYTEGNILDGELTADFPLYRVPLDGLNVGELVPLFEAVDNFDERLKALIDGTVAISSAVNAENATSLGGETAEEWQGKIDEKLDKSGGTVDGFIKADYPSNGALMANNTNPNASLSGIGCYLMDEFLGVVGVENTGTPVYRSADGITYPIFHTGNKPKGTYTGNGDATQRVISLGATGEVCAVFSTNGLVFVTKIGYYTADGVRHEDMSLLNGNLYISSTNTAVNASGVTYTYGML